MWWFMFGIFCWTCTGKQHDNKMVIMMMTTIMLCIIRGVGTGVVRIRYRRNKIFPASVYLSESACTKLPPAACTKRWCWLWRSSLQVVGVPLDAPSAFFKGENSSSLSTSHTAKFLAHWWHKHTDTDKTTGHTDRRRRRARYAKQRWEQRWVRVESKSSGVWSEKKESK